jgi:hypothetical protein
VAAALLIGRTSLETICPLLKAAIDHRQSPSITLRRNMIEMVDVVIEI